ncbi:MAG TPA: hypothetical protein VJS88_00730, partial [Chthoniobacterales bacterium]|nr:hypothetical protein [Chthoniobacterales bacterium]
ADEEYFGQNKPATFSAFGVQLTPAEEKGAVEKQLYHRIRYDEITHALVNRVIKTGPIARTLNQR